MWKGYKNFDHHFIISQLDSFLEESQLANSITQGGYLNIPCAFDIETSSYKKDEKKFAWMYVWQVSINGSTIYGRTWDEFKIIYNKISQLIANLNSKIIIYVHNLSFEFQFIRKMFKWKNVFSIKERRPVYAITEEGVEFRCSYFLSNYALAYIGDNLLLKYPVKKLVGDLDYSKLRLPATPLTNTELAYALNDVRVVSSYIQEKIEAEGGIDKIPLTNTGYVRNFCRKYCMTDGLPVSQLNANLEKKKKFEYHSLMKQLQITSQKEYIQLKEAFGGGFTHANAFYVNEVAEDVGSADLTSSYPFTMVAQKFPMSQSIYIGDVEDEERFEFLIKNFCCLFTVEFFNISSTILFENYISVSHCIEKSDDRVVNNGRLVSAEHITITITELDYDIICKTYDWDEMEIHSMRVYEKSYLPRPFIMSILELYSKKTSLKGVEGKEVEYMVSKNMINAAFGMAVTDIVRDEITYDGDWHKEEAKATSQLNAYNKNFNRFLYYAWGVWVTAHARHNLWDAILEFGMDYIYSDTDSIKGINFKTHQDFFDAYNYMVGVQIREVCAYHKIPESLFSPETIKGEKKQIGLWDVEEGYKYFKTLGAKRYLYQYAKSKEMSMTVSGVNKKYAMPYIIAFSNGLLDSENDMKILKAAYTPGCDREISQKEAMKIVVSQLGKRYSLKNIFDLFDYNLYIPRGYSGKNILSYIDDERTIDVFDYLGNQDKITTLSGVHVEPAPYLFSRSEEYANFINGLRDGSF